MANPRSLATATLKATRPVIGERHGRPLMTHTVRKSPSWAKDDARPAWLESTPLPRPLSSLRPRVDGRRRLQQQHVRLLLCHRPMLHPCGTMRNSPGPTCATRSRNSTRSRPCAPRTTRPPPRARARRTRAAASPASRGSRSPRPRPSGSMVAEARQLLRQVHRVHVIPSPRPKLGHQRTAGDLKP